MSDPERKDGREGDGAPGGAARHAVYRCLNCQAEWVADPFPADCPDCGHVYVQWLNYEDRKW